MAGAAPGYNAAGSGGPPPAGGSGGSGGPPPAGGGGGGGGGGDPPPARVRGSHDPFASAYQEVLELFRAANLACVEIKSEIEHLETSPLDSFFESAYDDNDLQKLKNSQQVDMVHAGFIAVRAMIASVQNHLIKIHKLLASNLSKDTDLPPNTWLTDKDYPRMNTDDFEDSVSLEAAILNTIESIKSQHEKLCEQCDNEACKFGKSLHGQHSWLMIFRHLSATCETALTWSKTIHEDIGPNSGQALCRALSSILGERARAQCLPAAKRRRVDDGGPAGGGHGGDDGDAGGGGAGGQRQPSLLRLASTSRTSAAGMAHAGPSNVRN